MKTLSIMMTFLIFTLDTLANGSVLTLDSFSLDDDEELTRAVETADVGITSLDSFNLDDEDCPNTNKGAPIGVDIEKYGNDYFVVLRSSLPCAKNALGEIDMLNCVGSISSRSVNPIDLSDSKVRIAFDRFSGFGPESRKRFTKVLFDKVKSNENVDYGGFIFDVSDFVNAMNSNLFVEATVEEEAEAKRKEEEITDSLMKFLN